MWTRGLTGGFLIGALASWGIACGADDGGRTADDVIGSDTQGDGADTKSDDAGGDTDGGSGDGDGDSSDGDSDGDSTGAGGDDEPPRVLTYHDVQQKSSHNSYERHEALIDQLAYHRIRSLELDIHSEFLGDVYPGEWFVYHDNPLDDTTCVTLRACLDDVRAFTAAVPEHEPITLWIDLKTQWSDGHSPADLDALLDEHLGGAIYTPADLLERCPEASDVRGAALECGWPSLEELRGRIFVMLTGGGVSNESSKLSYYLAEGALGFAAPNFADELQSAAFANVAVLNGTLDQANQMRTAIHEGFIGRMWGINDEASWMAAVDTKVHHIATDKVNWHRDPWAVTHDSETGWPFTCVDNCGTIEPEEGGVLGMHVDSGDIWDNADNFLFAHLDAGSSASGEDTWTAFVSSANSHIEPWVKGCIMARVDLEPGSPYFAVCRPADEERIRTQVRENRGGGSGATEHDIVTDDALEPTSVAWIRLDIDSSGNCATGYGAHRWGEWVEIDSHCFDEPLRYRGLASSSHGAGPVHMLFVAPRRGGDTLTDPDLEQTAIGGANGALFTGPIPPI